MNKTFLILIVLVGAGGLIAYLVSSRQPAPENKPAQAPAPEQKPALTANNLMAAAATVQAIQSAAHTNTLTMYSLT